MCVYVSVSVCVSTCVCARECVCVYAHTMRAPWTEKLYQLTQDVPLGY